MLQSLRRFPAATGVYRVETRASTMGRHHVNSCALETPGTHRLNRYKGHPRLAWVSCAGRQRLTSCLIFPSFSILGGGGGKEQELYNHTAAPSAPVPSFSRSVSFAKLNLISVTLEVDPACTENPPYEMGRLENAFSFYFA